MGQRIVHTECLDFQPRSGQSLGDLVDRKRSAGEEHALAALRLSRDLFHESSSTVLSRDQVGTDPHFLETGCGLWTDGGDPGGPEEAGVESLTFELK